MNGNLLERRTKMLKLRAQAFPLSQVVKLLSGEYEVTTTAIYKDWRNRKTWQKQLLELGDLEQLCVDLYATHKEIYRMAVREYLSGDNSNARVGALRLMRDLNHDFITMFPNVIKSQIKDEKGKNLNKLLKEYDSLFNPELQKQKEYKISWMAHRAEEYPFPHAKVDITKFTQEERETVTEACRLIKNQLDETQQKAMGEAYKS
jgi:hypothetical protein